MLNSLANTIGNKAQKVAQAVQDIQKDLHKEHRSRGGGTTGGAAFDEAEAYKTMLVGFQMDQARLGKEFQVAMREKQDEAAHWKKLYVQATKEAGAADAEAGAEGEGGAAGALGVDETVKLRAEVDVLKKVMGEWEQKLEEAFQRSTEETALRMKLEHETTALHAKVKELDKARAASEDLILSLSAEKTRMLGSSGEASETIDDLVDEYSRLASEHTTQRQMDAETIRRLENVRDELVEKLKAHERNILQLLQRGESEGEISREMTERSVVGRSSGSGKADGDAGAGIADSDASKSWTTEEVQAKLDEQAAELRAEKEDALAELRSVLAAETSEVVKRESAMALSLAAEGHAAAMKRAVLESAANAGKEAEESLRATEVTFARQKAEAVEEVSKAKQLEKEQAVEEAKTAALAALREELEREHTGKLDAASAAHATALAAAVEEAEKRLSKEVEAVTTARDEMSKALEETKASLTQTSAKALEEQEAKLMKEMEDKLAALRKELEGEIEAAKAAREETNALYAKENRARKAIHNKLMELQGNIRVLARVRPMLEVEVSSGKSADVTAFPADGDIVIKKPKENKGMGGTGSKDDVTETRFEFDRVFRPDSTQEGVFEAVGPLVTSVLDGYNVCIFAYGQTGSGKTFTMEGPDANPGVNTRALTDMFREAAARSGDVEYTFHMGMMEIYNEAVYDLLSTNSSDKDKEGRRNNNTTVKTSLDIRQNAAGGTSVQGLTEVVVSAMPEVAAQLELGGRNRAVGAHDMNEHSSRSHMIFNVRVEGTNVHTGAVMRAKLNLIDLAGSERISKTDATGERLREAQNINRSLSALGDVISALAQGKGHVPFRNSKLTYVLQDALSGNSKVMMFVNVSPASYNVTETLCSLNFAARCRSVKLGPAVKNQEGPEVAKYRRANEALHAQLIAVGVTPAVGVGGGSPNASPSKTAGGSKTAVISPPVSARGSR